MVKLSIPQQRYLPPTRLASGLKDVKFSNIEKRQGVCTQETELSKAQVCSNVFLFHWKAYHATFKTIEPRSATCTMTWGFGRAQPMSADI